MANLTNPAAPHDEEDIFNVWFEQYRMQSWLRAKAPDDGAVPSKAWGLGSRPSLLRGWLARAALASRPPMGSLTECDMGDSYE